MVSATLDLLLGIQLFSTIVGSINFGPPSSTLTSARYWNQFPLRLLCEHSELRSDLHKYDGFSISNLDCVYSFRNQRFLDGSISRTLGCSCYCSELIPTSLFYCLIFPIIPLRFQCHYIRCHLLNYASSRNDCFDFAHDARYDNLKNSICWLRPQSGHYNVEEHWQSQADKHSISMMYCSTQSRRWAQHLVS